MNFNTEGKAPNRLSYFILALCVTTLVFFVFLQVSNVNQHPDARFSDMVYGKAHKPFVYRILLPVTIRLTTSIIPPQTRAFLSREVGEIQFAQKVLSKFHTQREYLVEAGIALTLLYLSLLGFVFALRYLLTGVFRAPPFFADMVPLLATLGLVPFFTHGYLYDPSVLFFFTLELGLLVRDKWRAFLLIFPFACLNKETSILLTLVFAVHFYKNKRIDWMPFIKALLFQVAFFVMIKLALSWVFKDNPGTVMAFHLPRHLRVYRQYPLLTLSYTLVLLFIAVLMFYKREEKPEFLLYGTLMIIPLYILYLLGGWPYEIRVFYEVYPIVLLLSAHTIGCALGMKVVRLET
jgi:hypothetical protein